MAEKEELELPFPIGIKITNYENYMKPSWKFFP